MNIFTRRVTRFILPSLFGTFAVATCFNCFFYNIGPVEASKILADIAVGNFNKTFLNDGGSSEVEAQLRAEGYGQLREPANGRLLKLGSVTVSGRAYDGSPTFHAYYKSFWHNARLMAYYSDGRLHLHEFCEGNTFGCRYERATEPVERHEKAEGQASSMPGLAGVIGSRGVVAGQAAVPESGDMDEKPWKRPQGDPGPDAGAAAPVNTAPSEKAVLLKQNIAPSKERPMKVSNPDPVAAFRDPVEQLKIPTNVQPWLGTWTSDGMKLTIGFSGGKVRVGKSEAHLKGAELVYLKQNEFGRPIWVKLNFSDGLLFAKEESQYGEVIASAVLKR